MTQAAASPKPRPGARRNSAYDAALIKAKRDDKMVDLVLAADFATPYGQLLSADETIPAKVCHVDTYAVEFLVGVRKVWISKTFLAGVWL